MKRVHKLLVIVLSLVLLLTSTGIVSAAPKTGKLKDVGIKIVNENEIKEKSLNLKNIKETNMKKWSECFTSVSYHSLYSGACVIDPDQPKYVYYNDAITVNGNKYDLRIDVKRTTPKINPENTMVLDSGTWPREYLNVAALGDLGLTRLYTQNDGGSNDSKFDVTITFYRNGEKAKIKNSLIGFRDPDYANYYFDTNRAIYYKTAPNSSGTASIEDVYNVTATGLVRPDRMSQSGFSAWTDALFAIEIKNEDSFKFTIEGQSDLLIMPTFYTIERKYNITYKNLRGASNDNPSEYISGNEININNPGIIDGYTFVEWEEGNKIEVDDFGDKVFTAVWDPYKYKINYDGNGASNEMTPDLFTYEDAEFNSKENSFVKEGYNFLGFKLEGREELITTPENFKELLVSMGNNAEITLVAQWEYEQMTQFVDIDTDVEIIPAKKGILEPEEFENYVFVKTKEAASEEENQIHYYHLLHTSFVDEEGIELKDTIVGLVDPVEIEEYVHVDTKVLENKDVKHIYHKPMTRFVDEANMEPVAEPQTGKVDPIEVEGYVFAKSKDEDNGDVTHIYHKLVTNYVDTNGKSIYPQEEGIKDKKDISGYKFVETKKEENGDITHIYQKLVKLTFVADGKTLKEEMLPIGSDGVSPANPTKTGYKFKGWDKSYKNIQQDTVVTAIFEKINESSTIPDTNNQNKKQESQTNPKNQTKIVNTGAK